MPWILRTKNDLANPTLPGGVYGRYITMGMPVYYNFDGSQTRGIIFIGDGGKYGLSSVSSFEYNGSILNVNSNWIFHPCTYSTGFSDPVQGLPTFCPEVNSTFNNIAYVEFKLPVGLSTVGEEPDWSGFRIIGFGRKLMQYNSFGTAVGVTSDTTLIDNVALQVADNYLVNFKGKNSRIDWSSWYSFYTAAQTNIYYRPSTNDAGSGLMGGYYSDTTFTALQLTRLDSQVNFRWGNTDPVVGVSQPDFSVRWTGRIKGEYSQTYTFSVEHTGDVKLYIDGSLVVSGATAGTHTGTYTMSAGQTYAIVVDLVDTSGNAKIIASWSSASQPSQVIPADALFPPHTIVRRYAAHMAFGRAVEAADVHEALMACAPGWDWSDRDGKITFLSPTRTPVYDFIYDYQVVTQATIVKGKLTRRQRLLSDRPNFLLGRFRDVAQTGYPFGFVQADRNELRELTGGVPSNDPATDLGVATRSLAERILEMFMVVHTDPDHIVNISGGRASSKVRKCDFVNIFYRPESGSPLVNGKYMVMFHSWGAMNEQNDFTLLPMPTTYYTDELA